MCSLITRELKKKPHAVCIPYPSQGHVTPMLKMAKLLHFNGFHITFVNTQFNHQRLLNARGSDSLNSFSDFKFEAIPDGLPPSDNTNATQNIPSLCKSISINCLTPFCNLLSKLKMSNYSSAPSDTYSNPPVTCIISDAFMTFTLEAAQDLGIPCFLLVTISGCGYLGALQNEHLLETGIIPLKDESYLTNGYLDTPIYSIKGMEGIRLKDLPAFLQTTDPNDEILSFVIQEMKRAPRASAIIFNTFEALEFKFLRVLKSLLPPIYAIGPLQLHLMIIEKEEDGMYGSLGSNLWKEDLECLKWLDSKEPNSVLYVNFGSITVMTPDQMIEFAWGLANSKHPFLWIIRPDLVIGEKAILPPEFTIETEERSMISSWCPQEQVLNHPSIGGFLTHSGWNSTLETVCSGVPILSWPFFAEQQTNCHYACGEWGIGMEIDKNVRRDKVECLIGALMEGEKGKQMKKNVMEWKRKAEEAIKPGGSSKVNLDILLNQVLPQ